MFTHSNSNRFPPSSFLPMPCTKPDTQTQVRINKDRPVHLHAHAATFETHTRAHSSLTRAGRLVGEWWGGLEGGGGVNLRDSGYPQRGESVFPTAAHANSFTRASHATAASSLRPLCRAYLVCGFRLKKKKKNRKTVTSFCWSPIAILVI